MFMVAVLLCSLGMIVVLGQTQNDMLSGGDAGDTIDSATLIIGSRKGKNTLNTGQSKVF